VKLLFPGVFLVPGLLLAACSSNGTVSDTQTPPPTCATDEVEFVPNAQVAVWVTTGDRRKLLSREPTIHFEPAPEVPLDLISIDLFPERTYQTVDGFGATFTDSSTWLIWNRLDEAQRDELMRNLFDPNEGAGFSFMRHAAGASDFALSSYTYDDLPEGKTDPQLEQFSIEHDRAYTIPVMKQALALNPALKLFGTSWSAPAWMKTSESLIGGRLKPEFFSAAAHYLLRYVAAFAAEGLPIFAISLQNEPGFAPLDYPGMLIPVEDQRELLVDHIGPLFENVPTKLITHDHNWDLEQVPLSVMAFPRVRQYIWGTAFHCYGGNVGVQSIVKEAFPEENTWLTECTGLVGSAFDEDLRWLMANVVIGTMRNSSRSALMWNLALDQNSGPRLGGCPNCRGVVTINQDDGGVEYNVEYYALAHGAKAASPGAVRIASAHLAGSIENAAFRNPDGTWGLVVLNAASDQEIEFGVRWGDQEFVYRLPAGATATFRWPME
jgi:glucosylceramidase